MSTEMKRFLSFSSVNDYILTLASRNSTKDCTKWEPQEKNRAVVSGGHTPNFHCIKKEMHILSSCAAYLNPRTTLDSTFDNYTFLC
jgi:hypothetical protein